MRNPILCLVLLASGASSAYADVGPASVYSRADGSIQTSFGTNSAPAPGTSQVTIGADSTGAAFISTQAGTPDVSLRGAYAAGQLPFNWDVTSTDASTAPVLVHVTTSGWIQAFREFTPFSPGAYNPSFRD